MLVGFIIFIICWIITDNWVGAPRPPKHIREEIVRNRWTP